MPTYDYECDACDHRFDAFQTISDDPLKKCPKCGKKKLRRLFGAGAGLIFKGSGFYLTDYRSDSYKQAAAADKPAAADAGGSSQSNGQSTAKPTETKAKTEPKSAPKAK
ncbi:MAG TPA: FmdB family zinc ribbon protein [Pirellulaceae bacterium]|jgi:putative FmdB family regulatory protein|nr:FmdB family zinc ribbon protein [Pirellulaceae bacterium]